MLPKTDDMSAWSVVACDQFTSEPEYWQEVYKRVGDKPSTLRMILPEAELGDKDPAAESEKIYAVMSEYLDSGIFAEHKDSYIYIERKLNSGVVRRGIIGMFDLEAYDWVSDSKTPIRATEFTVEDRLPPRVKVREKAVIELPHIMVFMNDPEDRVFNAVLKGEKLYDFELMQNGGHICGWKVSDNAALDDAIDKLHCRAEGDAPIVFAMGDGNHSIAAAKKYWESVKKSIPEAEWESCPSRYALAELVNIHDEAITFEPIHKVIFNTEPEAFINDAMKYFGNSMSNGKKISLICENEEKTLELGGMTIGQLIGKCEDFCKSYTEQYGGRIDYIHGDEECVSMSRREGCAGILLPRMEKSELFTSVMNSGPFPKKSFSIGHGPDKRYYLECRRIK